MTESAKSDGTLTTAPLTQHPAVRHYTLFCLSALFLLVVCLADRRLGWWCLAPALVGCLALLTNWNHGPPLVLLSLAFLLVLAGPRSRWTSDDGLLLQRPALMDLILCMAVLAYVLGHYRLLSLTRNIFPMDSRRQQGDPSQRRSADLVTGREIALLGWTLPLWTGLSVLIWALGRMDIAPPSGMRFEIQELLAMPREVGFIWAGLALLAAVGIAVSYQRWTTATPEECLLYLQDQCWRLTRREQSSLNRWLTWARLRRPRKKESP